MWRKISFSLLEGRHVSRVWMLNEKGRVKPYVSAGRWQDKPVGKSHVFIESVGNLVCPASYDAGAHINIALYPLWTLA